jgi:hypothetical protein
MSPTASSAPHSGYIGLSCGESPARAPESFATFQASESSRTPAKVLAHMGDLYDWALAIARGEKFWQVSQPLEWSMEVERFFAALKKFDDYLASSETLHASAEKLFQGPIADSLTHVGQIAMLRRIASCPVKGENYFVAEIEAGRVGLEQAAPRREFD